MVDDYSRLPRSLQPPAQGDTLSFTWTADIGGDAAVGDVAAHLADVQTALDLGARWGVKLAESAALLSLEDQVLREGPGALASELEGWPELGELPLMAFEEWLYTARLRPTWRRVGSPYLTDPDGLLRLLASRRMASSLGTPARTTSIQYRNPVEIVLLASGFVLAGSIKVLTLIRDWSSRRRQGAAAADIAASAARRSAAGAELAEWLVDEARAGRLDVPVGDLITLVSSADYEAIDRLSSKDVSLELPGGTSS